jgi:hypothetical protein
VEEFLLLIDLEIDAMVNHITIITSPITNRDMIMDEWTKGHPSVDSLLIPSWIEIAKRVLRDSIPKNHSMTNILHNPIIIIIINSNRKQQWILYQQHHHAHPPQNRHHHPPS